MTKRSLWDRLWRRLDRWARGWMEEDVDPRLPKTLDEWRDRR